VARADERAVEIGLVSDTHLPDRLPALPAALFDALRGVDLVLHAGDVGALAVLDDLSALAPVVAVHGNDDTEEAQRELPYQQVIAFGGTRLLLCHTHIPDRAQELANRRDDAWLLKLQRRAAWARRAGASILVYGHTHVAMAHTVDGVLLVNPGALAAPNFATRQRRVSVARLTLAAGAPPTVTHLDLTTGQPFAPVIDWAAGYRAAFAQVSESILDPALTAAWPDLAEQAEPLLADGWRAVLRRAALPCWTGARPTMSRADLLAALQAESNVTPAARTALEHLLTV
jgi:putative phosphoesterase